MGPPSAREADRSLHMKTFIVGHGKLARELLQELRLDSGFEIVPWVASLPGPERSIVVHAGSGRELPDVLPFCRATRSPLVELATGSSLESWVPDFPVILCPNTNFLMLKFLSMLARSGQLFQGCSIQITESHQAGKTSLPGTALAMAQSMGQAAGDIVSIRDPEEQQHSLQIPPEHLNRHALHRITIQDAVCQIAMETRVYGAAPYAPGVARILAAIQARSLENRLYPVQEFLDRGWI